MKTESKNKVEEARYTLPPFETIETLKFPQGVRIIDKKIEYENRGIIDLGIPSLWKFTRGDGIKIAVLDTGLDFEHDDFKGAFYGKYNAINPQQNAYDDHGHGTHIAGIIGARNYKNNKIGIAPESHLYIVKVLNEKNNSVGNSVETGIKWAIKNRVDIIHMSLQGNKDYEEVHEAIKEAVNNKIFVICAAGNSGPAEDSVKFPAKYSETVAVGAIDSQNRIHRKSSRGAEIHVVAPGVKILSTFFFSRGKYAQGKGTSAAAAFVTGILALMLARQRNGCNNPVNDHTELLKRLEKTSTDLGRPGRDNNYGFGLINPEKLLESLN